MEPIVKILYSESDNSQVQSGCVLALGDANSLFEELDVLCEEYNTIENIVYEISCTVNDKERNYVCSQNLGDGDGSAINHLRKNAIEVLELLETSNIKKSKSEGKDTFSILQNSYKNMIQYILPELEAYCIAYKAFDVVSSFGVDNCCADLRGNLDSLMLLVKGSPQGFIAMLEEIIEKNPDNLSLISSVEVVIDKTEQYIRFVSNKEGNKASVIDLLREATKRATVINSNSVLYGMEPYPMDNGELLL